MDLPFKPFEQMTPDDYAAVGLMCGLEVHQQLRTNRKLFCRCPAGRYREEHDAEILRHMRPTLSELGEYDGTALMEKKTRKNIFYRLHHDTVCTYEFDDTPPFFPDERAIDIAIEISLLLRLNLVGELHIARKQYLDGSIPTGFQRTGILGVSGWLPYRDRRIGVRQLSLEEDSCREVSDFGHDRVYLTDRLGMPLIEVVTEPDMRTPQECAEVCQLIRMLCRSTGKVRTGYGAGREDVNVSVRGGTRIEIKGVPQITRIPRLIYNEAMRQWSLLQVRDELKRRGVTPDSFAYSSHDVTRAIARTQWEPLRRAVDSGLTVRCAVLNGFAGLLNTTTQEHTTFAKEFSDRVRVIACLSQLPNIVHSDSAAEALSARDWKELRRRTRAGDGDALVVVWGSPRDTVTACEEIAIRAREATVGIPSDTRQAHKDGTNGFERVLPGPERMYPDTDLPPIALTTGRVEAVHTQLPEYVWDREQWYRSLRLPEDVIFPLCVSPRAGLFRRVVEELGLDAKLAAVVLVQRLKALRRAGLPVGRLDDDELFAVFAAFAEKRLAREGIVEALERLLRDLIEDDGADGSNNDGRAQALLRSPAFEPAGQEQVRRRALKLLSDADPARFATAGKKFRHTMGRLMKEFVGRMDGGRIAELLRAEMDLPAIETAGKRVEV